MLITEEFLSYLWKNKLIKQPIYCTNGELIVIKKQGEKNHDAGPDFTNALIKIGKALWSGSVEIHIKSSDWFKHKHHFDKKYKSVILHAVYFDDLSTEKSKSLNIPTLILKNVFDKNLLQRYTSIVNNLYWIPCEKQINSINRFRFYHFIIRLAIEQLEFKAKRIDMQLKDNHNNLEQAFYEQLARNFGFKTNGDAFEMLAKSMPVKYLALHKNNLLQIESMLFGQAGMLDQNFKDSYPKLLQKEYSFLKKKFNLTPIPSNIWKFFRLRPSNFPTIRISQFAMLVYLSSGLLSHIIETENINQLCKYFNISTNSYWDTHFNFDKKSLTSSKKYLGTQAIHLILINTVVPFLFVYGKLKDEEKYCQRALNILESIKGEHNHIIRQWKKIGINTNSAFFTQALIYLKSNYCDKKRCIECHIGHELLKQH